MRQHKGQPRSWSWPLLLLEAAGGAERLPAPATPAQVERAVREHQREQRHQQRADDRNPVHGEGTYLPSRR